MRLPWATKRHPSTILEKGATTLRPPSKPGVEISYSPAKLTDNAASFSQARPAGKFGELEQALLAAIQITVSDLQTLAANRAKAIREVILQGGLVESDRIFLIESQPGGSTTNGCRAFLRLK